MSKKLDPAFKSLKAAHKAMVQCPSEMWRATLEFLYDKFVSHEHKTRFMIKEVPHVGE